MGLSDFRTNFVTALIIIFLDTINTSSPLPRKLSSILKILKDIIMFLFIHITMCMLYKFKEYSEQSLTEQQYRKQTIIS